MNLISVHEAIEFLKRPGTEASHYCGDYGHTVEGFVVDIPKAEVIKRLERVQDRCGGQGPVAVKAYINDFQGRHIAPTLFL